VNEPAWPPASAVVLAGGLSRRLNQDKRRLKLWGGAGPTLLEHSIALVGALCTDVVVVLNDPELFPGLPARIVGDAYPDGGALAGIYSGLAAAREPYALVVACDMPLLNPRLLTAMLARPRDYDVLVPRAPIPGATRNRLSVEPLHAIYGTNCLAPLRTALEAGHNRITDCYAALRVAYVEPEELRRYDPAGHALLNLNTPVELETALRIIQGEANAS